MSWGSPTAWYQNDLPPGARDLTRWFALQFRAGVNFEASPYGLPQDFTVKLVDGVGASASMQVGDSSGALFFPPGEAVTGDVPKAFLNTVSIPLTAFTGIQLSDVRSIRFEFDQSMAGDLLISDIAFSDMLDADGDGIGDRHDNCIQQKNATQLDYNLQGPDGFGNICDPDVDETNVIGSSDFNILRICLGKQVGAGACNGPPGSGCEHDPDCGETDYDGNGVVGASDFIIFRMFGIGNPPAVRVNEFETPRLRN